MISDAFSKALNVTFNQLSNYIEIMQRKGNDDGTMPQELLQEQGKQLFIPVLWLTELDEHAPSKPSFGALFV